jgi:hypothetical protein
MVSASGKPAPPPGAENALLGRDMATGTEALAPGSGEARGVAVTFRTPATDPEAGRLAARPRAGGDEDLRLPAHGDGGRRGAFGLVMGLTFP